jgi:hypothetical protein
MKYIFSRENSDEISYHWGELSTACFRDNLYVFIVDFEGSWSAFLDDGVRHP